MEKTIDIIILLMLTTNMIMLIVFFIKLSGKNNFIEILEKIKKNDSNQKEIYKRLSEKKIKSLKVSLFMVINNCSLYIAQSSLLSAINFSIFSGIK